jgi:hypothetical protein
MPALEFPGASAGAWFIMVDRLAMNGLGDPEFTSPRWGRGEGRAARVPIPFELSYPDLRCVTAPASRAP